jgi:hypothetical protein
MALPRQQHKRGRKNWKTSYGFHGMCSLRQPPRCYSSDFIDRAAPFALDTDCRSGGLVVADPNLTFGTVREVATADDTLRFSGYSAIDFTLPEDAPVYDAVQKFTAFNLQRSNHGSRVNARRKRRGQNKQMKTKDEQTNNQALIA